MKFRNWLETQWLNAGFDVKLSELRHGHLERWLTLLDSVPRDPSASVKIDACIEVYGDSAICEPVQAAVEGLIPWRKGPFSLYGNHVNAEWQSNRKWDRVVADIDLVGKSVLDVGSGNGYYGFRMLQAGAKSVIGVESSIAAVLQAGLCQWLTDLPNTVVPYRFGSTSLNTTFDVVFSMGVLYHQRDPWQHLHDLRDSMKKQGKLVLETLIAPQEFIPKDRYANMRNVYLVPTIANVQDRLYQSGFTDVMLVNTSQTSTSEQRSTKFSPGYSLSNALKPDDPSKTIEGYPAPTRAIFVATID